jgi:hypothetical protein
MTEDEQILAAALDSGRDVRVSLHEAAHAAVTYLVGGRVHGPVSIRECRRWGGVAYVDAPCFTTDRESVDLDAPLPLWPADVRRSLELSVMILQAGELAERCWLPAPARCRAEPELALEVAEVRAERAVQELDQRDRDLLALGDLEQTPEEAEAATDAARAFQKAWTLCPAAPDAVLAVLRSETRRLVLSWRCEPLLKALAAALLEHEELTAEDVLAIFEEADPQPEGGLMPALRKSKPLDGRGEPIQAGEKYVAWQGFVTADHIVPIECEAVAPDPRIDAAPGNWVPASLPRGNRPTVWDKLVAEVDAGVAAEAEQNRIKLSAPRPPKLYRLREDRVVDVAGRPVTYEKGSLASEHDDIIAHVGADYWEVVPE